MRELTGIRQLLGDGCGRRPPVALEGHLQRPEGLKGDARTAMYFTAGDPGVVRGRMIDQLGPPQVARYLIKVGETMFASASPLGNNSRVHYEALVNSETHVQVACAPHRASCMFPGSPRRRSIAVAKH